MAVTETVKIVFEVDNKPISDTVTDLQQLGKVTEQDAAKFKQLGEASKQAAKDVTTLDKSIDNVVDTSKDVAKSSEGFVSLRTKVKEAKEEVQRLSDKFGEFSPQANAARERAGELADKMSDLNRQVNLLNPEAKIKAFTALGQGIVGSFQLATGALQAFGTESEEINNIIKKLQGGLNIVQGISSLKGLKESFKDIQVVLGFTAAAQTGLNKATETGINATELLKTTQSSTTLALNASKIATGELTAVTNLASTAWGRFTAVLAANPLTSIAVGIGLIAGAFLLLKDDTEESTEAIQENNEELIKNQILAQNISNEREKRIDIIRREIALIEGKLTPTQVEVAKLENERSKALAEYSRDDIINIARVNKEYNLLIKKLQDLEAQELKTEAAKKAKKAEEDRIKKLQEESDAIIKQQEASAALQRQFEQELANQLAAIDKQLAFNKLSNSVEYYKDVDKLREEDKQAEVKAIDDKIALMESFGKKGSMEYETLLLLRKKLLNEEVKATKDANDKIKEINGNTAKDYADLYKKQQQLDADLAKERIDRAFQIANQVFDIGNTYRQAEQDELIKSLEARKENGLISEKEYQKELRKLKQKAAEDDKKAQVFQATMNAAQAILSALAGVYATPGARIAAVTFASVVGALNLAKVIATPIPKFNKGTLSVPGIDTGGDSVMAMLRPGEAVIPTDTNRSYAPSIKAIYQKQIKPSEINAFVLNKLSGRGSIGRDTAITASVDTFALSKAMNKNRAVEVTNANIVGKVIANEMMKAYNPRR